MSKELTRDFLLWLFDYDSKCGNLIWKNHWHKTTLTKIKNKIAGNIHREANCPDYRKVTIAEKEYAVHRLIFFIETSLWPEQIDHIDGNGLNNKFENLRPSTQHKNQRNRKSHRTGRLPNCYFCKDTGLWRARFKYKNRRICLGRFETEQEAYNAAQIKSKELGII